MISLRLPGVPPNMPNPRASSSTPSPKTIPVTSSPSNRNSVTTPSPPRQRPAPAESVAQTMLTEEIGDILDQLTPREARILRLRYGLQDGESRTLKEVGEMFGLSRERIRQLEKEALRKLRHPNRSHPLRDYLEL